MNKLCNHQSRTMKLVYFFILVLLLVIRTQSQNNNCQKINCTATSYSTENSRLNSDSRHSSDWNLQITPKCSVCSINYRLSNSHYIKCSCQTPYMVNLINRPYPIQQVSIQNQYCFTNTQKPCILCTDKYKLDQCLPAYYKSITRVDGDYTTLSIILDTQYKWMPKTQNLNLSNIFSLTFGIDGQPLPEQKIVMSGSSNYNKIYFKIENLSEIVKNHYRNNGYNMNVSEFQIKLKKQNTALFYSTNNIMPQSYVVDFSFKSSVNGFYPDKQFTRYYDGSESINFYFQMPNVTLPSPSNTSSINNQDTSGSSGNSSSNTQNSSQSSSSSSSSSSPSTQSQTQTQADTTTESQPNTIQSRVSNNYGIKHDFTPNQVKIKQGIQVSMVFLCSLGLVGTGASNWLTFSLANTHSFKDLEFYGMTSQQANSSAHRLLLTQVPQKYPNIQDQQIKNALSSIANLTLTYNPLILSSPQTQVINTSRVFSSYTKSLVFTNFTIIASVIILSSFLLYMNAYTKTKTHYDHSHIFKTLSQRNMVKRVVYMTLRGVYPIMLYSSIIFVENIFQFLMGKGFRDMHIEDFWNIAYVAENCIFVCIAIGLPIFGMCYFDKKDKHNVYIYSRMFGNQQHAQEEQNMQKSNEQNIVRKQSRLEQSDEASINKLCKPNTQKKKITRFKLPNNNRKGKCTVQEMMLQSNNTDSVNIKHKSSYKTSFCDMNTTTNKFLEKGSVKQYKSSRKPQIFFIFEYLYTWIFILVNIFMNQKFFIQNIILVSTSGMFLLLMIYFSLTVGVSRTYAVVRIIQIGLIFVYFVCRIFWAQSVIAVEISLYLSYLIGVWAIIHVLFSMLSMLYWEKKGIGIYAFFATKIIPLTQRKQIEKYTKSMTKLDELLKTEAPKSCRQLTEIQQLEMVESQDRNYEQHLKQEQEQEAKQQQEKISIDQSLNKDKYEKND